VRIPKLLENGAHADTLRKPGKQQECNRGTQDPARGWRQGDFQMMNNERPGSASSKFFATLAE
jgi:hypothetical protein